MPLFSLAVLFWDASGDSQAISHSEGAYVHAEKALHDSTCKACNVVSLALLFRHSCLRILITYFRTDKRDLIFSPSLRTINAKAHLLI